MSKESINKYNTAVRQTMSDKYVECTKRKCAISREMIEIDRKLKDGEESLSYREYMELSSRYTSLSEEYKRVSFELDIWDQAREICLELADEML